MLQVFQDYANLTWLFFAAISPRECLPSTSKKPSLGPADFVFLFFYEAKFSDLAALACAPEHQSIVFARFIPKTEHIPFLFFLHAVRLHFLVKIFFYERLILFRVFQTENF